MADAESVSPDDRLTRIDATTIVPGHGEVESDWSYVNQLIPLFAAMSDQVGRAVASGADLEATRKAVNREEVAPAAAASAALWTRISSDAWARFS